MMYTIKLELELDEQAAVRLLKGMTGNDDDVTLAIEKSIAAILGVEAGCGAAVELREPVQKKDLEDLVELFEHDLEPKVRERYLQGFETTSSLAIERWIRRETGELLRNRAVARDIVDAVGEALGVDTGTIHESRFEEAVDAARGVLGQKPKGKTLMQVFGEAGLLDDDVDEAVSCSCEPWESCNNCFRRK
jgi:hypothetical protein